MNTFITVFNAFPAILATVQALELAIPMPKTGQEKLNLVLGAAATAWELGEVGEQINGTNMLAAVEAMTNIAVAGLNAAGVFGTSQSKTTTTATVTPATPVSSN
jgi:hypothetical protein